MCPVVGAVVLVVNGVGVVAILGRVTDRREAIECIVLVVHRHGPGTDVLGGLRAVAVAVLGALELIIPVVFIVNRAGAVADVIQSLSRSPVVLGGAVVGVGECSENSLKLS